MSRLFMYPKDIMVLTGKSERQARRIHKQVREVYGKGPHTQLTFEEFCAHYEISVDSVMEQLK